MGLDVDFEQAILYFVRNRNEKVHLLHVGAQYASPKTNTNHSSSRDSEYEAT